MKKSILLILTFFLQSVADSGQYGGVQPLNVSIPSFDILDDLIKGSLKSGKRAGGWIEQGLTYFVHPINPRAKISDSALIPWRNTMLATRVDSNNFSQADADAINQLGASILQVNKQPPSYYFKSGYYEPNWDALVGAIQKGNFVNLIYYRLILSEYLLGRMAAAVSPLVGSAWLSNTYPGLPSDQDIINEFIKFNTDCLTKVRYARNAFTPAFNNQSSQTVSGWGQINNYSSTDSNDYIHYLKPVDTFAGLILVNRTSGNNAFTLGGQTNQVQPGTVGFYPVTGSADKWDSAPVDGQLWGKKRSVSFSVEGMPGQGQVQLYEDQKQLPEIFVQGPSGTPIKINFDDATLQSFFKDPHPWTIVVKSTPENVLQIIGLAKLNTISFPNALNFVGNTTNSTSSSTFSLGDLWAMPMNLYNKTISSVNEAAGQSYPLAFWVLQALFNGYLQTSGYCPLVAPNMGKKMWKEKWQSPADADLIMAVDCFDWKLLRALLVTQAANRLMYINNVSLGSIEQILSDPKTSIQNKYYVGASGSYVPVVSVKS